MSKKMIDVMNEGIEKLIESGAFAYGKSKETDAKYFIGYEADNKTIPLFIEILQMTGYFNVFRKNHYMNFLIKDKELQDKYKSIQNKIENIIKKKFDAQSIYKEKYLNNK